MLALVLLAFSNDRLRVATQQGISYRTVISAVDWQCAPRESRSV
jgi:hypothetical protein